MDQLLQVFVTVAEKKNFSRAAEELLMTQPAVSQYIKTLERNMETTLLERNNKMVHLTKAGDVVYHHAKDILTTYDRMQHLVGDMMKTPSGKLAIGASYTFGEYVLPHVVATLREAYPQITPLITIHNTREISDLVTARQLDVGIVEGQVPDPKHYAEVFADDQMVTVAASSHPLVQQSEIIMSDLEQETWIVREKGSGTHEVTERMFASYHFVPAQTMPFGSTQVIKEAVEAGLGITFLSKWAIRKELTLGTLKILPVRGVPYERKFSLITPDTPYMTKATEVFVGLLRQQTPVLGEDMWPNQEQRSTEINKNK